VLRLFFYGLDPRSLPKFEELASRAARCIYRDLPYPLVERELIGVELLDVWVKYVTEKELIALWVNHVTELALRRSPDSSLRAEAQYGEWPPPPEIVQPNYAVVTLADPALVTDLDPKRGPQNVCWPANVFLCSAWAINSSLPPLQPAASGALEGATTEVQDPHGSAPPSRRKRRAKGQAEQLLSAALDRLISEGIWGKTDQEIMHLADDVSPDTFYRLTGEDGPLHQKLSSYRRQSRGRGPIKSSDL
jgi:hypothetical protein